MSEQLHNPTKRVIDILGLLSENNNGLTLNDISKNLKLPKSTIFPILRTLSLTNFVYKDETTLNYFIGVNAFKVGYAFLDHFNMLDIIKKHMRNIVDKIDEICQLGILDKTEVIYIAKIEPVQPVKLESSVGKSLPAHATALGKALLSRYSENEIRELYKDGLKKLTKNTITDIETLIKEIETIKEGSIAYETSQSKEEIECLSVPLKIKDIIFAAISVSIPTYRSSKNKLENIKKILLESKSNIEKELYDTGIPVNNLLLF